MVLCVSVVKSHGKTFTTETQRSHREPQRVSTTLDAFFGNLLEDFNAAHHETLMEQPVWNFEQEPGDERLDETSVNLRAYFDRMPDEKMQQYRSGWTDEQTIVWDDNFREDGNLMLLCCEREVDVREYRKVLENCIDYRNRVRAIVTKDR